MGQDGGPPHPKHGSRLDVAEVEPSALGRPYLDRRLPDQATLTQEVAAWADERNAAAVTVDRQITAAARTKRD